MEFAESGHPTSPCNDSIVQRYSQKQRTRKTVDTFFAADQKTIETIFRKIASANQLSLYGAVAKHV